MNLRHLESFVAVARAQSFIKAAAVLGYAQPTVTQHVQLLEKEIAVELFARAGKRTRLSTAGQLLFDEAVVLLERVDDLECRTRDVANGRGGSLRIGSVEPAATMTVAPVVGRFTCDRPGLSVHLEVGGAQSLIALVASGELDMVVCPKPSTGPNLTFVPTHREPVALLIPRAHRLAKYAKIEFDQLCGERLIASDKTCAYRSAIEERATSNGVDLEFTAYVSGFSAMRAAVDAGMGIGVLPAFYCTDSENAVARQIACKSLFLEIGMLTRTNAVGGPALDALSALLRKDFLRTRKRRPGALAGYNR